MEINIFNRNSISLRLIVIGFLILILIIPSAMMGSLVHERENRKNEAIHELASKWAWAQTIGGPVLTIPFNDYFIDDKGKKNIATNYIQILPSHLTITGSIKPEIRYRGMYHAVLYNTVLNIQGSFSFTKLSSLNVKSTDILWNDTLIALKIPDMRGIKDYIKINWDNKDYLFEPGIQAGNFFDSGVSVKIPLNQTKETYNFSLHLNLNGSEELNFLPLGQVTTVQIASPWSNPSFAGAFLPETRTVTKNGFTANWKVLDLNRNYPQIWIGKDYNQNLDQSQFGVKLFSPVDSYTKTTRAVKYLLMFVGLTFLVFFLVEMFNKKKIHPIQYLLIGLSLCIFYLLLLSLSEHISFELAYIIAGLSITSLITAYVRTALGGKIVASITAGLLIILYTFLYILLQNQDYALLLGSIGIFTIMAIVMYLSRNFNWYQMELNQEENLK